jgi:hypothetical protein
VVLVLQVQTAIADKGENPKSTASPHLVQSVHQYTVYELYVVIAGESDVSRVGFMRRCEEAGTRARLCERAIHWEDERTLTEDGSAMRCDDE